MKRDWFSKLKIWIQCHRSALTFHDFGFARKPFRSENNPPPPPPPTPPPPTLQESKLECGGESQSLKRGVLEASSKHNTHMRIHISRDMEPRKIAEVNFCVSGRSYERGVYLPQLDFGWTHGRITFRVFHTRTVTTIARHQGSDRVRANRRIMRIQFCPDHDRSITALGESDYRKRRLMLLPAGHILVRRNALFLGMRREAGLYTGDVQVRTGSPTEQAGWRHAETVCVLFVILEGKHLRVCRAIGSPRRKRWVVDRMVAFCANDTIRNKRF